MGILPGFEPKPKLNLVRNGLAFQLFELNTIFPKFHPLPIFRFFYFPIFLKKYDEELKSNYIMLIYTSPSIGTSNITQCHFVVFLKLNHFVPKFWRLVPFFPFSEAIKKIIPIIIGKYGIKLKRRRPSNKMATLHSPFPC